MELTATSIESDGTSGHFPGESRSPRLGTLLDGVAELREWLARKIPPADTLPGFDLFLKLSREILSGRSVTLGDLGADRRHDPAEVVSFVTAMRDHGFLMLQSGDSAARVVPTPKLLARLAEFQSRFERQYIPRQRLRASQLLVGCRDSAQRELAELLYDRFFDLGWLYLYNYGASCFMMTTLLCHAARALGRSARIEVGYVELNRPGLRYFLGGKGFALPGQIEGHAMCVVDECTVLDFGLGGIRRQLDKRFYWGMAAELQPAGPVMARVEFGPGSSIEWKNDWRTPEAQVELARCAEAVAKVWPAYQARYA